MPSTIQLDPIAALMLAIIVALWVAAANDDLPGQAGGCLYLRIGLPLTSDVATFPVYH